MDDLVRFKVSVVNINGDVEEALKVVRILDGTESCTLGFLPCNVAKTIKDEFIGEFAQIIELYEHSENVTMVRKNMRNKGMDSFCLLTDIQEQE